ncbi:S1C family serine protease [bacterium]|nr:S1C family serine protease [bacterium]
MLGCRLHLLATLGILLLAHASLALGEKVPDRTSVSVAAGRVDSMDVLRRANRATVELIARTGSGRYVGQSNGAGVVISNEGYIVTAYHVVRDYEKLEVRMNDGTVLPATMVAAHQEVDIALVKVATKSRLEAASPASSRRITPGRKAMVVGNPLGMGQSVISGKLGTVRIVSWDGNRAPLRAIEADVVPGNSGGGAFDVETGELLGITVAKSSTLEGTGYIVPADQLGQLLRDRWPITAWIEAEEVRTTLGAQFRPVSLREGRFTQGLLVTHVEAGSVAEQSGWEPGDVLVGLGRYQTQSVDDVVYALDAHPLITGRALSFVLARDNARSVGVIDLHHPSQEPILAQGSLLAPMR